ncbi:MOSC domain-containing protein [Variovorax sp. KK3]|uniref:MOSC domain-containing protein n=1 Tax=Variovorax sp. KK3 TaxID=1855728 RepID=UPI00117FB302|nr:MOSC domain-containing protein [Variovorax sp. KK3]
MSLKEQPATVATSTGFSGRSAWQPLGALVGIYVRSANDSTPRPVPSARAVAEFGLADDRHASFQSPRQLLLASVAAYREWALPPMSLRENLLVDLSVGRLDPGDLLRVGDDMVLWLTFPCEPCGLLERRCPGTVKTIGENRGMLARVVRGGVMHQDDAIAARQANAPALSADWQDRVRHVAQAVPEGLFISHRQLGQMAGVPTAYCRAFPRVLSRLPASVVSRVRSEASMKGVPRWSGAGLFDISEPVTSQGSDRFDHQARCLRPCAPGPGDDASDQ